ncbi:PhzF family phenazine biosynthesis protein [Streptosporangium longisporum]|uniref:PhzF family phenazine biosynthesis protein n=1 Tax=Streptosporangium longisporum TaxID=46187 RepID=A0ABN3XSN7_9ACTN
MRFHVVDTFADESFAGNPAAVVVAEAFPAEEAMQGKAHRIGLPTTAFVVPAAAPDEYRVRWFTPYKEINLCGHATIASARHLFDRDSGVKRLTFVSDNGVLRAERDGDLVAIELQAVPPVPCEPPAGLLEALGTTAVRCAVSSDDILVEVDSVQAVSAVRPDFAALATQPFRGHIVTARASSDVDFVSRTFFPALGVNEDQVCVTAHCKLAPYWAERLGRTRLTALQLSQRGGRLEMTLAGDRVRVLGTAVPR